MQGICVEEGVEEGVGVSDRQVIIAAGLATVLLLTCALGWSVVSGLGAVPLVVLLIAGLALAALAVRGAWSRHPEQRS